jgi:hypothetical protein
MVALLESSLRSDLSSSLEQLALRLHEPRRLRTPAASLRGWAGLALAHSVLERALPGRGFAARAQEDLARATRALARSAVPPTLYAGFTGLGWTTEFLRARGNHDTNAEVDKALAEYLSIDTWNGSVDLISGLVGYGVYALERLPRAGAKAILAAIIHHLDATAARLPNGVAWATAANADATDVEYDLGVAHGVPGVIGFLARAWSAGIRRGSVGRLLDQAVAWVLSQRNAASPGRQFPSVVRPARPVGPPARLAWCYGDAGIACVLLLAAKASGEPAWRRAAVQLADGAAKRNASTSGVVDADLCHGSAGLAHVFQRLYVETGSADCRAAAKRWLRVAIASLSTRSLSRAFIRRAGTGFLTGASGATAALATFASVDWTASAAWDRVLLLSDRPLDTTRR